jgi:subtilisin family serine protease
MRGARALHWSTLVGLILVAATAQARVYEQSTPVPEAFAAPGVLIVEYHPPLTLTDAVRTATGAAEVGVASLDRIFATHGVERVERLMPPVTNPRLLPRAAGLERFVRIRFSGAVDPETLRAELAADPHVATVAYAMVHPVHGVPNDPSFSQQWALQDAQDNDVDGPEAWDVETGDTLVLLGATDTGVQYDHPDLAGPSPYTDGNVWINWMEYAGTPGTDDDGNGYVDDIRGWDWVDVDDWWTGEDGSTPDNDPMDFNGHGTHVSGIMAAMTNNGLGVAGLAGGWYGGQRGCKIVPLRIGWSQNLGGVERGVVRMDFAAQAFNYGVMMGVQVFNCSWGSSGGEGFGVAVGNALAHGVSICTSAGNDNANSSGYLENTAGVINVASTNSSDRKSGFSSYGPSVEVSAPGSSIYATYSNHGTPTYAYLSGTSMASPQVAGLLGLLRAHHPALGKDGVDSVAIHTADNIDALNPTYAGLLGTGRINARAALDALPFADFDLDIRFGQGPLAVQFTDHSYYNPVSWSWDLGHGETPTIPDPATVYTEAGIYTVSLTTQSDVGLKTTTKADLIRVVRDTVGGLADEAIVQHSGAVDLRLALSVPIDSLVFPFAATGTATIAIDSVSLDSAGAGLFTAASVEDFSPGTGSGVIRLSSDSGAVLAADVIVARYHFTVGLGSPGEELLIAATDQFAADSFHVHSSFGVYTPLVLPTLARVAAFPGGDVSQNGFVTSQDLVSLVGYVFKSQSLPDPDLGNVNGEPGVNASDVIYLVNYLFKSGPPPIG